MKATLILITLLISSAAQASCLSYCLSTDKLEAWECASMCQSAASEAQTFLPPISPSVTVTSEDPADPFAGLPSVSDLRAEGRM